MRTGLYRQGTRASNLATPKGQSDRADAAIRRMTDAIVTGFARADAERGQVIRDAVAKVEGVQS